MFEVTHKNKLFTSRAALVLAAGWLTLLLSSTYAQTGTSTVRGMVADQTNGVVSGATVTLRSASKDFTRTQLTNAEGDYAFKALPADTYIIEVVATGFKKAVVTGVNSEADLAFEVNINLEVGNLDISEDAPARARVTDIKLPIVKFRATSFLSMCGSRSYLIKDATGGYFMFTLHTPDMPHPITVDNPLSSERPLDPASNFDSDRPLAGTELELLVKLLQEWRASAIPKQKLRRFKRYARLKNLAVIDKVLKSMSEADSDLLGLWFVVGELEHEPK